MGLINLKDDVDILIYCFGLNQIEYAINYPPAEAGGNSRAILIGWKKGLELPEILTCGKKEFRGDWHYPKFRMKQNWKEIFNIWLKPTSNLQFFYSPAKAGGKSKKSLKQKI